MELNDYGRWTDRVWKSGEPAEDMGPTDLAITALGLAGESGEAIEYVKKYLRDGKDPRRGLGSDKRAEEFKLELGDIIFYWARLCRWSGNNPTEVLEANVKKLEQRHARMLNDRN